MEAKKRLVIFITAKKEEKVKTNKGKEPSSLQYLTK